MCIAVFEHEGDMTFIKIPGEDLNKRHKRNAVLDPFYLWSGGEIPYLISSSFDGNDYSVANQL